MKKINQKGYALLFTVVIVSIISLLVAGLSNTTLKQLVLSLGAKDSQIAFFQSDMAVECAMYAETQGLLKAGQKFHCGIDNDKQEEPHKLEVSVTNNGFSITDPSREQSTDPCFRISIVQEEDNNLQVLRTTVFARGYNICKKDNPRTVERTIEIKY